MGHMNVSNLSELFIELLSENASVTTKQFLDEAVRRRYNLKGSCGNSRDRDDLWIGFEFVLRFHAGDRDYDQPLRHPQITVAGTRKQKQMFREWFLDGEPDFEDISDDYYKEFDAIPFALTNTGRKAVESKTVQHPGEVTN